MTMHIDNYSFGRIVINNKTYSSDVIVYPDRVDPSWWRKEGHYLNKEDLSKVVMAKPDIVIIGTGQSGVMEVPKSTVVFLESHGIKVYIEKTGRGTIQQSRQFPAVTLRQVFSGRANLLFNKIEVIEQPFAGRRNTAGCLNSLGQEIYVVIYIIITDCYLEGFSQPAGAYTVFKLFKVKLILWDTEKFH